MNSLQSIFHKEKMGKELVGVIIFSLEHLRQLSEAVIFESHYAIRALSIAMT